MTEEAIIKELESMQSDLREMKRTLSATLTRYNHLSYRVGRLKRAISTSLRKEKAQAQPTAKVADEKQISLKFQQIKSNQNGEI